MAKTLTICKNLCSSSCCEDLPMFGDDRGRHEWRSLGRLFVVRIRISIFALLVCLFSACSKGSSADKGGRSGAPTATEWAILLALLGDLDVTQMDKEVLLSEISNAKTKARTEDRQGAFLDLFENQVRTWGDPSNDGEPQKRATSFLTLIRHLISAGPREIETRLQAASKLLELSYTMQNLDMDYRPVRKEAIQATKLLARSFPKEDRAHAQLGHVLITSDETEAKSARAEFETCLELNPSNAYCRDYLSRLSSL